MRTMCMSFSCKLYYMCWDLNPHPLEGQPVLLPLNHLSSAMNHFSFHNTT